MFFGSQTADTATQMHHQSEKAVSGWLFNAAQLNRYSQQTLAALGLINNTIQQAKKPFSGIQAQELVTAFDTLDLDVPLVDPQSALEEWSQLYLRDAIYFHHPKYVAHLNCPVVLLSLLAEQIISAINSSLDTGDQSTGATLIEQKVIDWILNKIGMASAGADGVFTSGGTQSNLMAMLLARDSWCVHHRPGYLIKQKGLPPEAKKWRIFTSKLSHFSIQKATAILGLGYDAVITVDYDEHFRLNTAQLVHEIQCCQQENLISIAVVATGGTTDFGSIDPLTSVAMICQHYGLWMHVDAAYGCGLLVSRQRLQGIEQADSVTVDYHKPFFQTVSCAALFVRDSHHLSHVTLYADYLNPLSVQQEGSPDLVNKSIQTTRRFDALKMWMTLRIIGAEALGDAFDSLLALARMTHQQLITHPDIEVLNLPELTTQIFRYIPHAGMSDSEIDSGNIQIRKKLFRSGDAIIASTKLNHHHYLKFTLLNPTTTITDIKAIITLIDYYGRGVAQYS